MDQLPALGTAIGEIVQPTVQIYAPLLLNQEDIIRRTHRQTFTYGEHPRQRLDMYLPSADPAPNVGNKKSAFMFLYGGGLVNGDKTNPDYLNGLVYANLGHYFAERLGIPVAVVDYRLIRHGARFPSGGEDVALAVKWLSSHLASSIDEPLDLYIMGNSAGGVHLSTYLLAAYGVQSRQQINSDAFHRVHLKGVIFLSVPFHFKHAHPSRSEALHAYYGLETERKSPLGLLQQAKRGCLVDQLRDISVLILSGSLDPEDEILIPQSDFIREWRANDLWGSNLTVGVLEGHNHISPVLAVGTGVPTEEVWATQVINFLDTS